ncbi:MAG: hypothetical protein JXP73_20815 [Deltaproteobacteria bacterium]|nr:hypothetical protein [Deltaproteobacteria bacterium]
MRSSRFLLLPGIFALSVGCSAATSQSIHPTTTRVRSASVTTKRAHGKPTRSRPGPVEASLASRGIRFGTDGSARALFAFVREHFPTIPAHSASRGDVLFFDMGDGCGSHAGLVETVEPSGRIGFRERRDGDTRHSYVTPREPAVRRDGRGRILNTFLRPKRLDDGPERTYFAGQMLCAVFRVETR